MRLHQLIATSAIFIAVHLGLEAAPPTAPSSSSPSSVVILELFTSEGCSSCPPADRLLRQVHLKETGAGQLIVGISEHVTYWNNLGWKDPYSSYSFSDRQSAYRHHFGLATVYTPQMVVDGEAQFTGSNPHSAEESITRASAERKIPVQISSLVVQGGTLQAHVEVGRGSGAIYVAVALNRVQSQVRHGENDGRRLSHVAVVQNLTKLGSLDQGKGFAKDIKLKVSQVNPANLRIIAFVQETGQGVLGRVLGSALALPGK